MSSMISLVWLITGVRVYQVEHLRRPLSTRDAAWLLSLGKRVDRAEEKGQIIRVTSIAGPIGRTPYAAVKWGVEGSSEMLAKEAGLLGCKGRIVDQTNSAVISQGSPNNCERVDLNTTRQLVKLFAFSASSMQSPGDPARAAAALLRLASAGSIYSSAPSFRLATCVDTRSS